MSTADTERYVRITLLTFEGGLWIARKILMREVDISGALTLDALLLGKNTLLKSRRDITKRQFETLFPISGNDTNIAEWDLSLLIRIIKILFGLVLSGQDLYSLDELLRIRNEIVCHATQPSVSEQDFYSHWTQLTICIGSLASHFDVATAQYASDLTQRLSRGPLDLQSSIEQIAKLCRNDEHMENILETLAKQERKLNEVASGVALANQKIDDVLAVVRELKRTQSEREEDVCRVVIPLLNTTVCISGKEDDVVKLAQDILLKVHKTAIDKVDNPNDEDTVKDAVQQFLADIESKGAVVVSAESGSIILKIRCTDLDGLDNMLSLFRDNECRCRLVGIENALSAVLLDAVKVELVLPDSTIEMLREWIENDAHVNKRYLNLGIQCDSVEAAVDVLKYLQGDESANRLNKIAEAMSRAVGDQVKVDAVPDVEGFSKGLITNAMPTRVEETCPKFAPSVPPARTRPFSFERQHSSLDCIQQELKILGHRINQELDVTATTKNLQKATLSSYKHPTDATYESNAEFYVTKKQDNEKLMVVCEPRSAVKTILHHQVGKHKVTINLNIVSSLCQIINDEGKVMPLDSNGEVWLEIRKRDQGVRDRLQGSLGVLELLQQDDSVPDCGSTSSSSSGDSGYSNKYSDHVGFIELRSDRNSKIYVEPRWSSATHSILDLDDGFGGVYLNEGEDDPTYKNIKVDETKGCITMKIKMSSDWRSLTEFEYLEECEPLQIALKHQKGVAFLTEHAQQEGSRGLEMSVIGWEYQMEELYTMVNREHEDQREEIHLNPEQCLARRHTLPTRTFKLRHHQNRDRRLRERKKNIYDYGPGQGLSAPWYHGNISRECVNKLMEGKLDGSFLVRDTLGQHRYTLEFADRGGTRRLKIWLTDNKYHLERGASTRFNKFDSVEKLIEAAMKSGIEVRDRNAETWKVVRLTPIERVNKPTEGQYLTRVELLGAALRPIVEMAKRTPIEKKGKAIQNQHLASIASLEKKGKATEGQQVTSITPIEGEDHTTEDQYLMTITTVEGDVHTTEGQHLISITPVEKEVKAIEDKHLWSITPLEEKGKATDGQHLTSITTIEGEDHTTDGQHLMSITTVEGEIHTIEN